MDTDFSNKRVLLIDGTCNLCNGIADYISKTDKGSKFQFYSLQSKVGQTILKQAGISDSDFKSFVCIIDNKAYTKSGAALKVFKELGSYWKLLCLFAMIPKPIRDFLYDLISKNRYRILKRRDNCKI
jgi:predicted DCC family thiol-disulfide oxidoreductase YuxK